MTVRGAGIAAAAGMACLAASVLLVLSIRPSAAPSSVAAGAAREYPHSFRLLIGDCLWRPPSPAAAVGAVLYFFGVGASTGGEEFVYNFHVALAGQYRAAGFSDEQAVSEVRAFDQCVASYVPEGRERW
ncbi:MAG TPA: hypothetical protein VG651_20240 [Stellaceae bacterium]|nr:hypothetical protein [Stellaceae bacterium]